MCRHLENIQGIELVEEAGDNIVVVVVIVGLSMEEEEEEVMDMQIGGVGAACRVQLPSDRDQRINFCVMSLYCDCDF